MTITFFGHRKLYKEKEIKQRLCTEIENQIQLGANKFLIGTHGAFDYLALSCCRKLRKKYPNIKIIAVFTSLHVFQKDEFGFSGIDTYKDVETMTYAIEDEYFKNQIVVNNRMMIDDSELVIAYVDFDEYKSGAKRAVNYAKRKNKPIINLFKAEDKPFYGLTPQQIEEKFKQEMDEINHSLFTANIHNLK